MVKYIFWDFDGTLSHRPRMFSRGLRLVLDENEKGHQVTDDSIGQWLRSGFPWHEPDRDYLHLIDPEAWWDNLYGLFENAYRRSGYSPEKARHYAREARRVLVAPEHYRLYEDTITTLEHLRRAGYRHGIVSNHVPELPAIAKQLGLMNLMDFCISSANVGYEKPNPRIFKLALEMAGNPESVWMVGDNTEADIHGAEALAIPAILVRRPATAPVRYYSEDLSGVIPIITCGAAK